MMSFRLTLISLFLCLSLFVPSEAATNEAARNPDYTFTVKATDLALLQTQLDTAVAEDKLLLVVLGGEWCHDSVALGEQFSKPELHQQLQHEFVVGFFDVGYLEYGFELVQHFNEPAYWGTPTVMVIDPQTKHILNRADLFEWSNAASKTEAEYQAYFKAAQFTVAEEITAEHQQQIEQFVQAQAERVIAGYAVVGPLLRDYKETGGKPSAEFIAKWTELRGLRSQIPALREELYQHALAQKKSGTNVPLILPQLEQLSWESGKAPVSRQSTK